MAPVRLLLNHAQHTRSALRRHWRYSAAFFAAVMLLTLVGSFLLPRWYYSDARHVDTVGSYESFREQTQLLEKRFQDAASKVRQAQDDWKAPTFAGKRKHCEDTIADIETKRLSAHSELALSNARIAKLSQVISSPPERIPTQTVNAPNEAANLMRQELSRVQNREQELLTKFSEKHPLVLAIRGTLADLQKSLVEQGETRNAETTGVNPSRPSLEQKLLQEKTNAAAIRSRIAAMEQQHKSLQGELHELNTRESQLAAMQREMELAESRYRAYAEKLEQARIDDQLDKETISNITLVQPASFDARPGGPRPAYVLGFGLIVALLGSPGVALFAAMLDPALKRIADVEELLRLPVLGTVHVTA